MLNDGQDSGVGWWIDCGGGGVRASPASVASLCERGRGLVVWLAGCLNWGFMGLRDGLALGVGCDAVMGNDDDQLCVRLVESFSLFAFSVGP